jgi:hypothetical protein
MALKHWLRLYHWYKQKDNQIWIYPIKFYLSAKGTIEKVDYIDINWGVFSLQSREAFLIGNKIGYENREIIPSVNVIRKHDAIKKIFKFKFKELYD